MNQAIPRIHIIMGNNAKCKQFATCEKASKSSRNIEGMSRKPGRCRASRGNLKEASEIPGAQWKLGRQWGGQEAGEGQEAGKAVGNAKQCKKNAKKMQKQKFNKNLTKIIFKIIK